jgi:hypothetical protein
LLAPRKYRLKSQDDLEKHPTSLLERISLNGEFLSSGSNIVPFGRECSPGRGTAGQCIHEMSSSLGLSSLENVGPAVARITGLSSGRADARDSSEAVKGGLLCSLNFHSVAQIANCGKLWA